MDIATYIGLAFGLLVIGAAVLTGSDFWVFLNLPGFLIVVAGSFAATLIRYPISGVLTAFAVGARAAFSSATDSKPRDPIVKALDEGTFDTVIGSLEFDDKGDVTLPGYVMYEWKDGKYAQLN